MDKTNKAIFPLSLAALGVVYGDIGTSPLYALRQSLVGLPINPMNVLGVLSLIVWSLIFVVSVKYLVILLRADNNGEGGILALLALIKRTSSDKSKLFILIAILGAGLVLGDGMLTPAISVLSAVEGIKLVTPGLSGFILPVTCFILVCLFYVQSLGTAKIGFVFGPILFIWFFVLAIVGIKQIILHPMVLYAINPYYAFQFFYQNGLRGYVLLGGIFLVLTGAEALYADLGHFGKVPIRLAWFLVVLPALLLNYFGQSAYLLDNPHAIDNPFYLMAPKWFMLPYILLATISTIIASQAVISASFSLTKQAVLLGFYPHLRIVQTSIIKKGQIYIPQVNYLLGFGTLGLILIFRSSFALTHAYGIAVNLVMLLTTLLLVQIAIKKWQWNKFNTFVLCTLLCSIDLAFLGANAVKLDSGGWIPILFAIVSAFIMYTWNTGRIYLHNAYYVKKDEIKKLLKQLDYKSVYHLPDSTAIFITDIYDRSGANFFKFLKMNRIVPENLLIINYIVNPIPYVNLVNRFQIAHLSENICKLILHYGFMDTISIPEALENANERGILPFHINIERASYFIEISNIILSADQNSMDFTWQKKLFAFLVRNYSANINIEFYQLPYDKTMAIGTYYLI